MHVLFCHPYAITKNEGLDRAILGLAKGLVAEGIKVDFISIQITPYNLNLFNELGQVHYQELRRTPPTARELGRRVVSDIFLSDTSGRLLRLLRSLAHKKKHSILVMAQEYGFNALLRAAKEKLFDAVGWWAFGTPHLYPASLTLRASLDRYANMGLDFISLLSPILNRRFWELRKLDFVISGCKWVCHILSYFCGIDCLGVVYPPTDTQKFSPVSDPTKGNYVFAIGDQKDIRQNVVAKVASRIPVIKAGNFKVKGAINVGFASDEELVRLYSNARFTIFPTNIEQFGLPVAESLACGTPVLTFSSQGPSELVIENVTGWKVNTEYEFCDKAICIFNEGYDDAMRKYCRRFAEENLSIRTSTKQFINVIEKVSNV